jgi:hypothetical protein
MSKPKPLAIQIPIGDKYRPAMAITSQPEADAYFESCVEHTIRQTAQGGKAMTREDAESAERGNLAYYMGYFDIHTRQRVARLFKLTAPRVEVTRETRIGFGTA